MFKRNPQGKIYLETHPGGFRLRQGRPPFPVRWPHAPREEPLAGFAGARDPAGVQDAAAGAVSGSDSGFGKDLTMC